MVNKIQEDIIDRAEEYADKWYDHYHGDDPQLWRTMHDAYRAGAEEERSRWYEGLTEGEIKLMDLFLRRPKAMVETYKQNSELQMAEDVAGFWHEQFMMCNAERQKLKGNDGVLSEDGGDIPPL